MSQFVGLHSFLHCEGGGREETQSEEYTLPARAVCGRVRRVLYAACAVASVVIRMLGGLRACRALVVALRRTSSRCLSMTLVPVTPLIGPRMLNHVPFYTFRASRVSHRGLLIRIMPVGIHAWRRLRKACSLHDTYRSTNANYND
jgi:hypothetical protein